MNRYIQIAIGVVGGIILLGLAALYWMTPSDQLPAYIPGYEVGVATIHFKHGLAAFILGIFAFIYAWFASGKEEI